MAHEADFTNEVTIPDVELKWSLRMKNTSLKPLDLKFRPSALCHPPELCVAIEVEQLVTKVLRSKVCLVTSPHGFFKEESLLTEQWSDLGLHRYRGQTQAFRIYGGNNSGTLGVAK